MFGLAYPRDLWPLYICVILGFWWSAVVMINVVFCCQIIL